MTTVRNVEYNLIRFIYIYINLVISVFCFSKSEDDENAGQIDTVTTEAQQGDYEEIYEEIDDYSDDFSLENFVEKAIDEIDWNVGEDDSIDPLKEKKHLKKRVGWNDSNYFRRKV